MVLRKGIGTHGKWIWHPVCWVLPDCESHIWGGGVVPLCNIYWNIWTTYLCNGLYRSFHYGAWRSHFVSRQFLIVLCTCLPGDITSQIPLPHPSHLWAVTHHSGFYYALGFCGKARNVTRVLFWILPFKEEELIHSDFPSLWFLNLLHKEIWW